MNGSPSVHKPGHQKMYYELANWWHLLSPPEDYAEEAADYWQILEHQGLPAEPTLLELGAGGGNNAFHLKRHFSSVTLTDLSPPMLKASRSINPDCEHLIADMRSVRLGRTFDVVMIHDAVTYMTNEHMLKQAMATAHHHLKPEGIALFVPEHVEETYTDGTEHGGREWSYDPDPLDHTYNVDYVFLLREGNDLARVVHDHHVHGLFPRADWLRWLPEIGLTATQLADASGRDVFMGRRSR